ncbi:cupin domain-containing protein [Streptomyces parvulus]|uniref:cupin domain-containing protein n=1 Tax=Streptomyces parvulus TaxID=146923 RepID=UPI0036F5C4DA
MLRKVVLSEAFCRFSDTWSPKIVGDINDQQVKLAKFEGEFVWHHHDAEDELFLLVSGALRIELRDGSVQLHPESSLSSRAGPSTGPSLSRPRRSSSSNRPRR